MPLDSPPLVKRIDPWLFGVVDAINQLVFSNPGIDGHKLVLHTTAEPCPMCQGAIIWTGIEMVVFGTSIRSLQKWGGDRSKFLRKKWFVAVRRGMHDHWWRMLTRV